jgi:hypothetical protein
LSRASACWATCADASSSMRRTSPASACGGREGHAGRGGGTFGNMKEATDETLHCQGPRPVEPLGLMPPQACGAPHLHQPVEEMQGTQCESYFLNGRYGLGRVSVVVCSACIALRLRRIRSCVQAAKRSPGVACSHAQ